MRSQHWERRSSSVSKFLVEFLAEFLVEFLAGFLAGSVDWRSP
jgi:hypothetical protein